MASATNFHAPDRSALLVIRIPKLERIAWQKGRRTAQKAERAAVRLLQSMAGSSLRSDDVLDHDFGSDVFVVTMSAPRCKETPPSPSDCRSVLRRVAAVMSSAADASLETGWCLQPGGARGTSMRAEISAALERGRCERERFDFFATVGHELRTPLTSIRGYLETLLEADCDASTSRRFLETARGEALRLGRLVDGMFEFSLLDLGIEQAGQRGCDVPLAIRTARESVAPIAFCRSVSIELLDTAAGAVAMNADACVQTLVNIVDNAIRHGREGGRIAISSFVQDGYLQVFIDDDGNGVCETERAAIFSFRMRGSRAHPQGTGIGLSIARTLVERAGGEIRVGDSPLGGARFELLLPLQAESPGVTS